MEQFDVEEPTALPPTLGFVQGLALVVGVQIGSGIFASPGKIAANAVAPGNALVIWAVCGALSWTGAASFAELGSCIPANGGTQAYLERIFGPYAAFMYTWAATFLLKPGSLAITALVFGDYVLFGATSVWLKKGAALLVVWVCTALNCLGHGELTGTVFLAVKLGLLAFIGVAALINLRYGIEGQLSIPPLFTSIPFRNISSAFYGGLWAYDGWDNLNFMGGQVRDKSTIPKVISWSMIIVILSYVVANLAYFSVLKTLEGTTVAVALMDHVLGGWAATLTALLIGGSCFGAINASTYSTGRIIQAAAEQRLMPEYFAATYKHQPLRAFIFQGILTTLFVLFGEFGSLVDAYGAAAYSFFLAAVLGLLYFRYTEPKIERPFKVWLSTPIIFCLVCSFLIVSTIIGSPMRVLVLFGFMLLAIPVLYIQKRLGIAPEFEPVPTEDVDNPTK